MSLFKTPTPVYKIANPTPDHGPAPRSGLRDWIGMLLRTPTPVYKTKSAPPAPPAAIADDRKRPPDAG